MTANNELAKEYKLVELRQHVNNSGLDRHFLQDRFSPSLLDEEIKKQENKRGASWGEPPYEKVVESEAFGLADHY